MKGTEEHVPQKRSFSSIIKAPLQNNCLELVFRKDTKYSRQYTFLFPGIIFPRGRNNKDLPTRISSGYTSGTKMYWRTHAKEQVAFLNHKSIFAEQLSLNAENHITKNKRLCKINCSLVISYCRYCCFMRAGILLYYYQYRFKLKRSSIFKSSTASSRIALEDLSTIFLIHNNSLTGAQLLIKKLPSLRYQIILKSCTF